MGFSYAYQVLEGDKLLRRIKHFGQQICNYISVTITLYPLMSKHQKALDKLRLIPPVSDLKWDELRALLEHIGYVMRTGSGSRRKFYNKEIDALIICHQPHPASTVDKGCVADIREHLIAHGFIK